MATPTSMFGMSPLDVMEQRIQQQAQENASRRAAQSAAGQSLGIFNPLYQAGLGFSDMAGQAARSLFGAQDPMLMKAAQIQQAMAGKDMNKPEDMIAFSQELAKMGYTAEAMQVAQQARTIDTETFNRRIKLAEFGQSQDKKRKENIDYYKKNPEQAEFRIAELAQTLSTDPTNAAALKEYTEITRAASEGAIEAAGKEEKASVDLEKSKTQLAKYQKDLQDAKKLSPAERLDIETQAARDLYAAYNIDPTKNVEQQLKKNTRLLYSPAGQTIIRVQQDALRKKTTESVSPFAAASAGSPPAAGAAPAAAGTVDFNALPR